MSEPDLAGVARRPYELLHRSPAGTAPGTLTTRTDSPAPVIDVMVYDDHCLEEHHGVSIEQLADLHGQWPLIWVDVRGLGDARVIEQLGRVFRLHPLALEDVVNLHQRPKAERYPEQVFLVSRMPQLLGERLELEQLSLFLAAGAVISVQERDGDCFDPVRNRIRRSAGQRGRLLRADYLAYALLDAVVDSYFPVLEQYSERLDQIERAVLRTPATTEVTAMLHRTRRELQQLRRAAWPQREVFRNLMQGETLVQEDTRPYLRDCEDHVVQIMDLMETYRERAATALDLQVTALSHRMNEVMKLLTIIATVFMSMTVVTGIYGMNFDPQVSPYNMPELGWRFGYPFALGLMALLGLGFLVFFWRRGWLGLRRSRRATGG